MPFSAFVSIRPNHRLLYIGANYFIHFASSRLGWVDVSAIIRKKRLQELTLDIVITLLETNT